MNPATRQRLFDFSQAFDHPVTVGVLIALGVVLLLVPLVVLLLHRFGAVNDALRGELLRRYYSWLAITPILVVPILLGAFWTILGVGLLSLFCYREFARATGLFREKIVSLLVTVGILLVTFSVFDHWYHLFVALPSLTVICVAAASILPDEPKGYIQRTALGVFGFCLFGVGLGHLGYFANDANYRPMLLLLILSVELNDIFAFISGKTFGRRKLAPNTSPNKTLGGALGALASTTILVVVLGHWVFRDTPLDSWTHLTAFGILISVAGQLGDLMLSSVKRDLGIKDMGTLIPGHGGLLDRFDSVLLVAPAAFHYIGYFVGVGLDQQARIVSGS